MRKLEAASMYVCIYLCMLVYTVSTMYLMFVVCMGIYKSIEFKDPLRLLRFVLRQFHLQFLLPISSKKYPPSR